MPLMKDHPPPDAFPTYLAPAVLSTRTRDTSSLLSQVGGQPGARASNAAKLLEGHTSYLRCACCSADLCMSSQIISKGFTGRHGRAYLVSAASCANGPSAASPSLSTMTLPNTIAQKPVPRQLVTGAHTVSDISCASCGSVVGWKYVAAEEESQKYKVGKFILETKRISTSSCWESRIDANPTAHNTHDGKEVEFDSQNEDECEDLFSGMWSPALARRRQRRGALEPDKMTAKG